MKPALKNQAEPFPGRGASVRRIDHVNYLARAGVPVAWTAAERAKGQAWGLKTIDTFHTHGTPPVDVAR